jgi:hypothetical protein
METDFLILGYGFTARYAAYELLKKFPDRKVIILYVPRRDKPIAENKFIRYKDTLTQKLIKELHIEHKLYKNLNYAEDSLLIEYEPSTYDDELDRAEIKGAYMNKVFGKLYPTSTEGNTSFLFRSSRVSTITFKELAEKLDEAIKSESKCEVIPGDIEQINNNEVRTTRNGDPINFQTLISTVPLTSFIDKLSNITSNEFVRLVRNNLASIPFYYYKSNKKLESYVRMVYDLHPETKTLRWINTPEGVIEESLEQKAGFIGYEEFGVLAIKDKELVTRSAVRNVRNEEEIIKPEKRDEFSNIKRKMFDLFASNNIYFAGRLGRWETYHYTEENIKDVNKIINSIKINNKF